MFKYIHFVTEDGKEVEHARWDKNMLSANIYPNICVRVKEPDRTFYNLKA